MLTVLADAICDLLQDLDSADLAKWTQAEGISLAAHRND